MTDMLVDGNSLFARSWFAAQRIGPEPAHALKLAINTVLLLLNPDTNRIGLNFDRTLFCWDGEAKPDKGRSEKPPEYHPTKEVLKEILTMMLGSAHAENPKFEGDDLVATAVHSSTARNVYVVSGDKDLMQLQSEHVHYYCLNTKAVLSNAFINSKWHIKRPSHVAIALAIIGDPVDNIKGIYGWGPKKVKRLFESITPKMDFASVVSAIDAQVPKEHKEAFWNSLDRTLLHHDVPGVPEPAPLTFVDPAEVAALDLPGIAYTYRDIYDTYAR